MIDKVHKGSLLKHFETANMMTTHKGTNFS